MWSKLQLRDFKSIGSEGLREARQMLREPRAIIVGGGIGGLTSGIALRQAGFDIKVYERSSVLGEVGAGIALASNAMNALASIGMSESIAACGVPLTSGTIKDWKGTTLVNPADVQAFLSVCVHRADLQRTLADSLPENTLRLGYELSDFEQQGDTVIARFTNGEEVEGDILVGADGIHSRVRTEILGREELRYSGYTAWRSITSFATASATSESWGLGQRFGIVPIGGGRVYWFATKNVPEGASDAPEGRKDELLKLFERWHHPVEALISATNPDEILRHDLYDRKPIPPPWGRGRVTLLGDAAHPTTPNLGQGACQAIEDAIVLAHVLRNTTDLSESLRQYERERAPRTSFITNLSWRVGRMAQLQNPVACWFRNLAMRSVPRSVQLRQLEKVQQFNANKAYP